MPIPVPPPTIVVGREMFVDICNDFHLVGPTVAFRQAQGCVVRAVYDSAAAPGQPPYVVAVSIVTAMVGGQPAGTSIPIKQMQPQGCWVIISTI